MDSNYAPPDSSPSAPWCPSFIVSNRSSAPPVEKFLKMGTWADDETASNTSSASLDRHLLQSGPCAVLSAVPAKYPSLSSLPHRSPAPLAFHASFSTVDDWIDISTTRLQRLAVSDVFDNRLLKSPLQPLAPLVVSDGCMPEALSVFDAPAGNSTGQTPSGPPSTGHGRSGDDGGVGGSSHGPGSSPPGEPSPQAPSSPEKKRTGTKFQCFGFGKPEKKYAECQGDPFKTPSEYWDHLKSVHGILKPKYMHCISSADPGCQIHRSLENAWFWCTTCRPDVNDELRWEFQDYESFMAHLESKDDKGNKCCKEERKRDWQNKKIEQAHVVAMALETRMEKCRCGPGCSKTVTTPSYKRKRCQSSHDWESGISGYKKTMEDLEKEISNLKQQHQDDQKKIQGLELELEETRKERDRALGDFTFSQALYDGAVQKLETTQQKLYNCSGMLTQAGKEIDYLRGMAQGKAGNGPSRSSITSSTATELSTLVQPEENSLWNGEESVWTQP